MRPKVELEIVTYCANIQDSKRFWLPQKLQSPNTRLCCNTWALFINTCRGPQPNPKKAKGFVALQCIDETDVDKKH